MPIPDYQTLMLPVLTLAAAKEQSSSEAVEALAIQFQLTPDERNQPMPSGRGQTLFANRVHWAVTYLVHANLVARPKRGHFAATEKGRQVLKRNLSRIDNGVLSEFPEFIEWVTRGRTGRRNEDDSTPPEIVKPTPALVAPIQDARTPIERMENDYQEIEATLREALLSRIVSMSSQAFEVLIVDLLIAMGHGGGRKDAVQAIGQSGDGGVDGVINQDALGLDVVYIQAKRYQLDNAIGRPALQAFVGSLDGFTATKGIFVTTSRFSREALEYVKRTSKRVILIDGNQLTGLMVQHSVGVRTSNIYELKRLDEDYFAPQDDAEA